MHNASTILGEKALNPSSGEIRRQVFRYNVGPLLALVLLLVGCCSSSEPLPMPEVARFVVRFEAGLPAGERQAMREGIVEAWGGTGAVVLLEGEPWAELPSAASCDEEIFVGWSPPGADVPPGEIVGYANPPGVGPRRALILRGHARTEDLGRIAAHEVGHAMGLDHGAAGVMAPTVGLVADRATCDDWRAFCAVYPCPKEPCP